MKTKREFSSSRVRKKWESWTRRKRKQREKSFLTEKKSTNFLSPAFISGARKKSSDFYYLRTGSIPHSQTRIWTHNLLCSVFELKYVGPYLLRLMIKKKCDFSRRFFLIEWVDFGSVRQSVSLRSILGAKEQKRTKKLKIMLLTGIENSGRENWCFHAHRS